MIHQECKNGHKRTEENTYRRPGGWVECRICKKAQRAVIKFDPRTLARFWASVDQSGDCWVWTGALSLSGYGAFNSPYRIVAHRYAYLHMVGEIPDGLQLDHLCRNRRCVNPDHLEPVTQRVNIRRGVGPSGINAQKTHCDRGHELSPANIYVKPSGNRQCQLCRRLARKKLVECASCGKAMAQSSLTRHLREVHGPREAIAPKPRSWTNEETS